jgi:hypothetical protein
MSLGFYYAFDISNSLLDVKYFNYLYSDGSSAARAGTSAAAIKSLTGTNTNGVYWINLPTIGPTQVYCIMDSTISGGGWMLALKATRGTTFNRNATYWTTNNNLNPTDVTLNDFPAKDWLAIWPYDTTNGSTVYGGDITNSTYGWTWLELNAVGQTTTLLNFYANTGTQITKASNGVGYTATTPAPTALTKFSTSLWSTQTGFQWYGINYGGTGTGGSGGFVRWGFAWNNESDQNSNDNSGGIGMAISTYSAGDVNNCCPGTAGLNRSMRVQWYIR